MPDGFTIKTSGAPGLTLRDYRCDEHGLSEHLVDRPAPEMVACPDCGEPAELTISAPAVHVQFVVTASHGKNDPKPHRDAMDTRMIAEGRKNDFRKQRKELREQHRKARVMELLR